MHLLSGCFNCQEVEPSFWGSLSNWQYLDISNLAWLFCAQRCKDEGQNVLDLNTVDSAIAINPSRDFGLDLSLWQKSKASGLCVYMQQSARQDISSNMTSLQGILWAQHLQAWQPMTSLRLVSSAASLAGSAATHLVLLGLETIFLQETLMWGSSPYPGKCCDLQPNAVNLAYCWQQASCNIVPRIWRNNAEFECWWLNYLPAISHQRRLWQKFCRRCIPERAPVLHQMLAWFAA